MQYSFQTTANAANVNSDCVIVGVDSNKQLSSAAQQIDQASEQAISKHLELGDFSGKQGSTALLYQVTGIQAKRVLLVGTGEGELSTEDIASLSHKAASTLKNANIEQATSFLTDGTSANAVRQSVVAIDDVMYRFDQFKSDAADEASLSQWIIAQTDDAELSEAVAQGQAIAAGMQLTRDLANSPGNVCTPTYLTQVAQELANSSEQVELTVLGEAEMEAMGMGSFMSVSRGSEQEGQLIVLQYNGGKAEDAPVALVGKGITFDTGGISLKPGARMDEMKYDMGGAASVLGTFKALLEMQLPLNMVVVVAAAENMPSGIATKPGDIVTSLSGKTIEVLNTDAEGRLVLCDALTYVERFEPAAVVDVATLTGACITALGHHTSGLLSNDDALANDLLAAGEQAADEAWRLPMNKKYDKQLQSNFADMANIGGPAAGTITAACFLARFAEKFAWAHLDIAGTAWQSGAQKGATARPVPLLTQFLLNRLA